MRPLGFFLCPHAGMSGGRVVLILEHNLDSDMLGLVRDVLAQPPCDQPDTCWLFCVPG